MPTRTSPTRLVARLVVTALSLGCLAAVAAPASAAQTVSTTAGRVAIDTVSAGNPTDIVANSQGNLGSPYPTQTSLDTPGTITDVDLHLTGLSTNWVATVDILLVGPDGRQAMVLSDVSGSGDAAAADLTFDDEAAGVLPAGNVNVTPGTYRPTDYDPDGDSDDMSTDKLGNPTTAPADAQTSLLSVFDGTPASGVWSLYLRTDSPGIVASATGLTGWSLDLTVHNGAYPSTVVVTGSGRVADVDLDLSGLTTPRSGDLDLLLVGPEGQQATVMSDVGGDEALVGDDLTFDDEAAAPLPLDGPVVDQTYRPTNDATDDALRPDVFAAPAPISSGSSALSVFDGTDPNGTWSLYLARDSGVGDVRLKGWSLHVTWADTTSPVGSLAIDGGAAVTTKARVTLSLGAVDAAPSGGGLELRLSNDGATYSAWQPYQPTVSWTLPAGDGPKTVFAQLRDADGNQSATVGATIRLDTQGPRSVASSPKPHATGFSTTRPLRVRADEALAAATVSRWSVLLRTQRGQRVRARVRYDAASRTIVIAPRPHLRPATRYTLRVRGVTDLVGHSWDQKPATQGRQPLRLTFTTE